MASKDTLEEPPLLSCELEEPAEDAALVSLLADVLAAGVLAAGVDSVVLEDALFEEPHPLSPTASEAQASRYA